MTSCLLSGTPTFCKGIYSKKKEFAHKGCTFFRLRVDSFSERTSMLIAEYPLNQRHPKLSSCVVITRYSTLIWYLGGRIPWFSHFLSIPFSFFYPATSRLTVQASPKDRVKYDRILGFLSVYMTFIQRRFNIEATSWRCIDADATLSHRCVLALSVF